MLATSSLSRLFSLALGLSSGLALADTPSRVVSINLCTDQMAMLLAPPEQLVSISYLSLDPRVSAMSNEAADYRVNHGDLEEIVALSPDLVLVHEWSSPTLIHSLNALGIATKSFSTPTQLESIPEFIKQMGDALGQERHAQALIQHFDAEKAVLDAKASHAQSALRLLDYGANGWVGSAHSLSNEIFERAGFENIAVEYGLEYGGFMPLEVLLKSEPDVVLSDLLYPATSRAESLMAHPALTKADLQMHKLAHGNAWSCGLPQSLAGFRELIVLRAEFEEAESP